MLGRRRSLGLLARLISRRDGAVEALGAAMEALQAPQASGPLPPLAATLAAAEGGSSASLHTASGTWPGSHWLSAQQVATARCLPQLLPVCHQLQAAGLSTAAPDSGSNSGGGSDAADEAAIAAARQRLQAYLQQQDSISQAEAVRLASRLSAKLGAAAHELAPPPLQFFVGRGMQPVKASELVAHICESAGHASLIRYWPKWQPVFEANWQLCDSYLAAYQQQCEEEQQRPLKSSESMAAMLGSRPSCYNLLKGRDLGSKLAALQQGQLGLTEAKVGQLVAAGLVLTGNQKTAAAATQWLVSFAGSIDAAISMLRAASNLPNCSAATLDSKVAALDAAWTDVLSSEQLRQLVQQAALILKFKEDRYGPTAAVLRSWFPQPTELLTVLQKAPALLVTPAASLQANQRWLMGPPFSLSRQQFLALLQAAPQALFMNIAGHKTQHKLAFLTQVGQVPPERALSAAQLNYLKYSTTALAGRYFLLTEHGVPLPRHSDGGIVLSYAALGLPRLMRRMRQHDSQRRLPVADAEALAYIKAWLDAWPQTESGRAWAKPPAAGSKS